MKPLSRSVFYHQLRVDLAHKVNGDFDDASVKSDKSVHFLFDVADLGVNGCRKSSVNLWNDCFFIKFFDCFCKGFRLFVDAITELVVGGVHMSLGLDCVAAEFAENVASIVFFWYEKRLEVDVQTLCVRRAFALIVPAAYAVDKTSGIDFFISFVIRTESNCPQPSLKGTHTARETTFLR